MKETLKIINKYHLWWENEYKLSMQLLELQI